MKNNLILFGILIVFSSCETESREKFYKVQPVAETEPVKADSERDAADDPAIWYNSENPEKSLILGSDKTNGVDVFDLSGKRVFTEMAGRVNNIDVRYEFVLGEDTLDIAGGSNRTTNSLDFWEIDGLNQKIIPLASIPSELPDVYGFCLYVSPKNKAYYAFINSKTGRVAQWRLNQGDSIFSATKVRELKLNSQVEGMVADDSLGVIFVGVEGEGIYRFDADEDAAIEGTYLQLSGEDNANIEYDVEGLAIYHQPNGDGYLIASSQGNYSYAVFERSGQNAYIGSFEIIDGIVDGVQETDGLEVSHHSFGSAYPSGVLICQDGYNFNGTEKVAQNFKMIHWSDVAKSFDSPLHTPE